MKMLPAAGEAVMRLRHEGCLEAVAHGGALHQALEDLRLVGRAQGVGAMHQADLELVRRILRDRGFQRQACRLAMGIKVVQEGLEVVELAQAIGLDALAAMAGDGRGGALSRPAARSIR